MFKKGDYLIKIIDIHGSRTATVQKVASVKKSIVSLEDSSLKFSKDTGLEVESAFAPSGIICYLVKFDDGETERLGLK